MAGEELTISYNELCEVLFDRNNKKDKVIKFVKEKLDVNDLNEKQEKQISNFCGKFEQRC